MRTLERAEPELAADLIENGIHMCGGGSLLRGIDSVISNATGLKVMFSSMLFGFVKDGVVFLLGNSTELQILGGLLGLAVSVLLLRYFYSLTTFESIKNVSNAANT